MPRFVLVLLLTQSVLGCLVEDAYQRYRKRSDGGQDAGTRPLVRRGECTLTGLDSIDCPITPPLASLENSMLVFQASSNEGYAPSFVSCGIRDTTRIGCERSTGTQSVRVGWQIVESPELTVQHREVSCDGTNSLNVSLNPVTPEQTFVLFSTSSWSTAGSSVEDFASVALSSSTELAVRFGGVCPALNRFRVQVVQWNGAQVERGTITDGGLSATVAPTGGAFLLFSYRMKGQADAACRVMLRGDLEPGRATFAHDGSCSLPTGGVEQLSYEVVRLPDVTVARVPLSFDSNQERVAVAITPLDPASSLLLSANQGVAGQSGASTNNTSNRKLGCATPLLWVAPDGSEVGAERSCGDKQAHVLAFVVQLR